MKRRNALIGLGVAGSGLGALDALAQLRIEVSGVGEAQIPIAIAQFAGDAGLAVKPAQIVATDLARSGVFRPLEVAEAQESARPDFARIRSAGADYVLHAGSRVLADGHLELKARLWDSLKAQDLGAWSQSVPAAQSRLAIHRVADWVHEKITGVRGVAATRIAYVTKSPSGSGAKFTLWVADADGENARAALQSAEPIISPAWAPDGVRLAYVSFESKKPVVYVHHLPSAQRHVVADFKGSNSAPTWAPDGKSLAVTLSSQGGSQIYLLNLGTGAPRRILQSASIDTEAVFSHDGKHLFFVSDRSGGPQVYRCTSEGSNVQRVTFAGNYNISPAVSPDGTRLAYITRQSGAFRLVLQDLASAAVTLLTETDADESPSFSPNGRQILYATRVTVQGKGQEVLMSTTVDGRVKSRLVSSAADIREPAWGF